MSRSTGPGGRPTGGGNSARRLRTDETLPGVQFPVVDDLNKITADDEFLDAIAVGSADLRSLFAGAGPIPKAGPLAGLDSATGRRPVGLGPLLMAWRSELLEPPLPPLPVLPARPMLAPADRSRRRSMRSLISVGAAICALLMASTAVGAHSAQPGEPLWGLSTVLWSGHAESVVAKMSVQKELNLAVEAFASHDRGGALAALARADAAMAKVGKDDGLEDLQRHYTTLRQQADTLWPAPGAGRSSIDPTDPPGNVGGRLGGGAFPPVAVSSSKSRTTASTARPAAKPGSTGSSATPGDPAVAQGGGTGTVDSPAQSVSGLPIVPAIAATTSSAAPPAGPGGSVAPAPAAGAGTTADPGSPPAGTTAGPTTPGTTDPVDTAAPTTPPPVTTPDPADPPPVTHTDPPTTPDSTTPAPPTADPSTTSDDPVPTSDDPTTPGPTTPDPTTAEPPTVSTTSVIPTTLDSTPSTDPDGPTTGDPSTTTTETGPVNSTDGVDTTANDPAIDATATGYAGDAVAPAGHTGP